MLPRGAGVSPVFGIFSQTSRGMANVQERFDLYESEELRLVCETDRNCLAVSDHQARGRDARATRNSYIYPETEQLADLRS